MGIRMHYTLSGRLDGKSLNEFVKIPNYSLSFGGFEFEVPIRGKNICVPFDWESYLGKINPDGTLSGFHGESTFFSTGSDDELDECFEEEWKQLGITREDLTADVMAEAIAIREFYVDYEPVADNNDGDELYIQRLSFLDEAGREYEVSDKVLAAAGNILTL